MRVIVEIADTNKERKVQYDGEEKTLSVPSDMYEFREEDLEKIFEHIRINKDLIYSVKLLPTNLQKRPDTYTYRQALTDESDITNN